jgi:hypothetical protein
LAEIDELLIYIFEGKPHILAAPMVTWLSSSRRFTAFVQTNRDKIRKKVRVTAEPESILDFQLELGTAYWLLQERALNVVYEPEGHGRTRTPDFAVTFTTSTTFMVEVTRFRTPVLATADDPTNLLTTRLADTICSKLGQLLPQSSNIILVGVETPILPQIDLPVMMRQLQQQAERNEPMIIQRHQFRDRADFFQQYRRLSELLIRATETQTGNLPLLTWSNPQATHPLPAKVRTVLYPNLAANGK